MKIKHIQITVKVETDTFQSENDFYTLQELKRWLDKHPDYAEKLGYIKKDKPK